jgi:hypothetical protein
MESISKETNVNTEFSKNLYNSKSYQDISQKSLIVDSKREV